MKNLKYLNKYFLKYKWRLTIGILITILSKFLTLKIPNIVGSSLNVVEDYKLNKISSISDVKNELFYNIILILTVTLIGGFFTFLMRQTIIVTSRLIEFDLKNEIYKQYQNLSINFYKKNRTGDLMNRISEDVNKVRMYLGPAIMYSMNMLISFIIGFYQMYSISPKLTFYTMIPFPILSISIFLLSKEINNKSTVVQQYLSKLTTFNQEFFSGINVVKSYSIEKRIKEKFNNLSNNTKLKNLNLSKVQALFFPLMILLIGISNLIVLYFGGKQFIAGEIQLGAIASFVMYVNILTWPVAIVGWVTSMVQQAEASQKRINEFLNQIPSIKNTTKNTKLIKGNIIFKNVSLTYENTNINALKKINFSIKQGETIAILGKTGSGKSSIINLICRLYDTSSGNIFIDDISIKNYNLYDLRNQIGIVPQDSFLFSETIENNIKFGKNNATKTEIVSAAKKAIIHNNIMKFKNGYNTILGERGVTLSGGQKQRLSIARAIIKKPKILVFDDCLSAIDTETEQKILYNLNKYSKNITTIIISHRISSVKNADKIIVLEKGKISQQGTHNQLIIQDGIYKDLYNNQISNK